VSDAYYGNWTGKNLPHQEAGNATQWGPVVDGHLLTGPPIEMMHKGLPMARIPILLGSNSDEGSTFLSASVYSKGNFQEWCHHMFGNTTGAKVFAFYSQESMLKPKPNPDLRPDGGSTWSNAATEILGGE
jgi:carboxylesterase type B